MPRIPPLAACVLAALAFLPSARADEPAPARAPAPAPDEWHREAGLDILYVSPTDAEGRPTHLVLRVVDDVTGDPIAGATAALHAGSSHPATGLVGAVATGVADADGWVRIAAETVWTYWTYVEAAGYAGLGVRDGRVRGTVRLGRARNVIVEVRDALDRPVGGATIGVRTSASCGHNPDQRVAVTDLAGRAVLPGLGPYGGDRNSYGWECWVVEDSISSDYHYIAVSDRPRAPQILRHGPSRPVEGIVLEADGTPAVGAHVGAYGAHRGPWTTTGPGGHFRLVGTEAFASLTAIGSGEAGEREASFRAPPAGMRATVVLPRAGEKQADPPLHDVDLTLVEASTVEDVKPSECRLVAVRDGDGFTRAGSDWKEGARLPAGSWTLQVGGGVSRYVLAKARVVLPVAKDAPDSAVTLELVRHPVLRVEFGGDFKDDRVTLVSETDERLLAPEELGWGEIPVPTDVSCALRVRFRNRDSISTRTAFVPIPAGPRPPDAPPLVVPPRPIVVRARLVDPAGKPVAGWLRADVHGLIESPEGARWEAGEPATLDPTNPVGAGEVLEVIAVPEGRALLPKIVPIRISQDTRQKRVLDLGTLRLEARGDRRVTVLTRDGSPIRVERLRMARGNTLVDWSVPSETAEFDPLLPPLESGDVVDVEAEWEGPDALVHLAKPVRRRLEGPGPWTVRADYPATSIALEAKDLEGEPLDATLVIDGVPYDADRWADPARTPHPFVVKGLDAGPHRVAVAAKDRLTHLYRVVLKPGEVRVLEPRMRPVPRAVPPDGTDAK